MNKDVFIISVGIAFLLQIIHSLLTKGWKFTLEFFGVGLIFGFLREYLYFNFAHIYEFPDLPIQFMNVPIFIPIGWVFTFYLAYEFVKKLVKPKTAQDYKDFIIFAMFFSSFICIPIETVAMNMHWWSLLSFLINDNIAPFGLMGGWMYTSLIFFYIYFSMKRKMPREQHMFMFIFFILIFFSAFESKLDTFWWLAGLIVGCLCMFKYNKELSIILLAFIIICFYQEILLHIMPNGILVTILFMFIFIYILLKLRYMYVNNQLSIAKSLG
jgi:hypothetical protein